MAALGDGTTSLVMGGLRGGGASEFFRRTENLQLTAWRLRHSNTGILHHYIQELAAATTLFKLPKPTKSRVTALSQLFDQALLEFEAPETSIQSLEELMPARLLGCQGPQ